VWCYDMDRTEAKLKRERPIAERRCRGLVGSGFHPAYNYAGEPRTAARDAITFAASRGGDENCLLRCDVMNGTVDYETQSFPQCLPRSVEVVVVGGRDLGRTGCWLLTYLAPCPTCCVGQVGQVCGPSRSPTCVVNPALVVVRLAYLLPCRPEELTERDISCLQSFANPRSGLRP
jgi:hypothetical protein